MMKRARLWTVVRMVVFAIAIGFGVTCTLEQASCTPEQIEHVRTVAPPVIRAGCVLLRAFTSDGALEEVCATAEELAPLVHEMIEERERSRVDSTPDAGAPMLAFSFEAPRRRYPRRRCVTWTEVDGGRARRTDRDAAPRGEDGGGQRAGSLDGGNVGSDDP